MAKPHHRRPVGGGGRLHRASGPHCCVITRKSALQGWRIDGHQTAPVPRGPGRGGAGGRCVGDPLVALGRLPGPRRRLLRRGGAGLGGALPVAGQGALGAALSLGAADGRADPAVRLFGAGAGGSGRRGLRGVPPGWLRSGAALVRLACGGGVDRHRRPAAAVPGPGDLRQPGPAGDGARHDLVLAGDAGAAAGRTLGAYARRWRVGRHRVPDTGNDAAAGAAVWAETLSANSRPTFSASGSTP